jgi:hypothetical protein
MKNFLRFFLLLLVVTGMTGFAQVAQSGHAAKQLVVNTVQNPHKVEMIKSLLPNENGTSGNSRAPQGTQRYIRTAYLITAAEIANVGVPNGAAFYSLGFNYYTAQNVATTGTLKIYLQNTSDATFLKSTTWSNGSTGTIDGMTMVDSASATIPAAAGPWDIPFANGSPFTYTGGGLYVAFEYQNASGTVATTANVAICNTDLAAGLRNAFSTTTPPTTLSGSSAFRPETRVGYLTGVAKDAAVATVYSYGKYPLNKVSPAQLGAYIANVGDNALSNVTVTLNVTGANTFTSSKQIASLARDAGTLVSFDPFTPTVAGNNNVTVTLSADDNAANNTASSLMVTTADEFAFADTSTATNDVGYGTGAGLILIKAHVTNPSTVNAAIVAISPDIAATGDTIYGVLLDGTGTIIATSDRRVLATADQNTVVTLPFTTTPTVTNQDIYVGIAQVKNATAYYPVLTQTETPNRSGAYYQAAITGGTVAELTGNGRLMLDVKLGTPAPKVTFRVNLAVQLKRGTFVAGTDSVVVRGDFQTDAGDTVIWRGNTFKLTPAKAGDTIYTRTVTLPAAKVGTFYNFKFVKDDGTWERNENRTFTLGATDQTLYAYYFNNDSIYVPQKSVTATVTFFADLRKIWGSGDGYFDETTDSLLIQGLGDWDSKGQILSGSRRLQLINPTSTGVYSSTIVIKGFAGDSTQFKYEAYPSTRFANTGWETGTNRYYKFPYSDSTYNLPYVIPAITPSSTLKSDVVVLFSLHFADTSKNAKNGQLIPKGKVQWVAVKGSVEQIGNWGGNWTAADTIVAAGSTYPTLVKMNDSGVDGDAVPGDGIWSKKITFPSGAQGGLVEFKYACMYPGADTVNGGTTPLDNEYAFQLNHQFMLLTPKVGNAINLGDLWGWMGFNDVKETPVAKGTSLSFRLEQNYPNPFNPSTKIKFMIPEEGQVTMKVYSVIGKEVATLINQNMKAGSYEQTFDASSLSTGVYIYKLTAGNYTSVKKMMFIK